MERHTDKRKHEAFHKSGSEVMEHVAQGQELYLLIDGKFEVRLVVGSNVAIVSDMSDLLLHEASNASSGRSVARDVGVSFLRGDASHLDDELERIVHETTIAAFVRACR
jgi:hypothetical protein